MLWCDVIIYPELWKIKGRKSGVCRAEFDLNVCVIVSLEAFWMGDTYTFGIERVWFKLKLRSGKKQGRDGRY